MAHSHELAPKDRIDPHEFLASDEAHGAPHEHHVHVTPFWTMFWVFIILLALTALTVWSSNIHDFWIGNTRIVLGSTPHIIMAMSIAVVKALLVGGFFMHLLYDKKVNTIVMGATIFAVALFIGLSLMDVSTRGVVGRTEVGEIYSGGNVSKYKGRLRPSAQGFAGNIVQSAQAEGAAAQGNTANPDSHSEAAPGEPAAPEGAETIQPESAPH